MEGAHVSVNAGGKLVSGRLKGRGSRGEYILISDRNGGTYYTHQPLMTHEEAGKLLSSSQPVIRRLIRDGKLKPVHVGRSLRLAFGDYDELVAAAKSIVIVDRPGRVRRRRRKTKKVARAVAAAPPSRKKAGKAAPVKRSGKAAAKAAPKTATPAAVAVPRGKKAAVPVATKAVKPAAETAPRVKKAKKAAAPVRKAGRRKPRKAKAKSRKAAGAD